ncbi:MAG: histidine kinase [Mucilaginibacter sp.]|nr:histidine kinase [Mucilaginibacter sp.]
MQKRYHLKACLLLIVILNLSVLLTPTGSSHLPGFARAVMLVLNTTLSITTCWLIHAELRIHPPKGWPPRYIFFISTLAGTIALLAVDAILDFIVPKRFSITDPSVEAGFIGRAIACMFISVVCYVIFNSLYTNDMLLRTRLEVEKLKQAALQTQVMGLQQQLSPHFLFNSLSTLKGLAKDADLKEFIMQLSHIYRYLLDSTERQIVTLADELEFVKAFLYIQEKRFGTAIQINLDIPKDYLNTVMPPLSLQLLLENAIKHNFFSQQQPLSVNIYVTKNNDLIVSNNYRPNPIETEGKGIGLQNIRERFQLLFQKDISIDKSADTFTVSLPLIANEDNYH